MSLAIASSVFLQIGAPLALVAWLLLAPPSDAASLLAAIAFGGAFLLVVAIVGSWAIAPRAAIALVIAAFGIASLRAMHRAWPLGRPWPAGMWDRGAALLLLVLAIGLGMLVVSLASARRPPPGPVAEIAFPLAEGRFIVGSGGFHDLLNNHRKVLAPGAEHLRGQAHAIDYLALGRLGFRARGLYPSDPSAYAIYGSPVVAPCAGRIVVARDGLPDVAPPQTDRVNPAGNHVLLACDGFDLLLAHLQRGSLRVREGDRVAVGDPIGRVGNSGNTTEPHLHVHAQRGPRTHGMLDADPVPLAIRGRFPIRNDIVDVR